MPTARIGGLVPGGAYGPSNFKYPSYWDVTLTDNPYYADTFDAWCVNPTRFLSSGMTGAVNLYSVYSSDSNYTSLNYALPSTVFSGSTLAATAVVNQLDNVNWLLNQHYTSNPQFNVSEVQSAIWRLLGYVDATYSAYLNKETWQVADVDTLIGLANTFGEGFVPGADDVVAVIADPAFNYPNRGAAQPLILETKFAKLGDFVWHDRDADGIQDANEEGIKDATVQLTGTDAYGASVNLSTTTDDHGNYLFVRLMPGTYQVRFTTPTDFSAVSPRQQGGDATIDSDGLVSSAVILKSGDDNRTIDAGFYKTASLGDRLWVDLNGDGIQNDGATGISGQVVTLIGGGADGLISTLADNTAVNTLTGADGFYQFTGLTPGVEYQVQFNTPAGTVFTTRDAGANDATDSDVDATGRSQIVTLASGENNPTIDAGVVNPTPGIEIIKDVVGTSFVAANTPVSFTYSVKNTGGVVLENIVVKDDGATPGYAADDFSPTAVLGANGKNIGDLNGDGKLDLNEVWKYSATATPPVNMTVTVAAGATPIESGRLTYTTLANGDIRVTYLQSSNFNDNTYGTGSDAGWTSQGKTHKFGDLVGSDKAGFLVKYSDGTTLAQFYQDYVTLSGSNTEGYSAFSGYQSLGFSGGDGSWVAGTTTAKTWLSDFDSTIETNLNQAGIANNGVAYSAMFTNSPVNDARWDVVNGYSFTLSAAAFAGGKSFGGVTIFDQHNSPAKVGGSNTYVPDIVGGASVNTAVVTGIGNGSTVTDDDDATVVVVTGPLGSLGDRVWFDANANGLQDAGEAGISGASVTLSADFNGDGNIDYTATTTTGANGIYSFASLPAGTYSVSVDPTTLGGTLTETYDLDGIGTLNTAIATLASGQNRTDVDFGYVRSDPSFTLDKVADKASAAAGAPVTYTYTVTNTTGGSIGNVVLRDDNATPNDASDDFAPVRQADAVGDNDNLLEAGEVWKYSATVTPAVRMTVTIDGTAYDSGTLTYNTLANGDIRVNYRQSFNFNDNTYGTGSEGWVSRTHSFSDLTGSDKAGFEVKDANGNVLFKFYQDYITASSTNVDGYAAYSGYQSLGFSGGDGSLQTGGSLNASAASLLYDFDSTLETNLNRAGYTGMTTNSPLGDANWDKVNGYAFTIRASAFAGTSFGGVTIFDQHNSPAKTGGSNSYIPVVVGGASTNTAVVTGTLGGQQVAALDDATVVITTGAGGGGNIAGSKFFVVDSGVDDVFGYGSGGAANGVAALVSGNSDGRGITGDAAGTRLWVLDKDKSVYVYASDGTALGNWVAGGLGKEPEGIALDGQDIWIVDREKRSVFWYDDAASRLSGTDNPEKTFALASVIDKPKGITTNGTFLWVVEDDAANTVFRYTITRDGAGHATGLANLVSWTLDARNTTPTGITLDPTGASSSLWVVDSGTDTVYEYADAQSRTSGSNVAATSTYKLADANTSAQDIFDPFIGGHAADAIVAGLDNLHQVFSGPADPASQATLPPLADLLDAGTLDAVLGVDAAAMTHGIAQHEQIDASGMAEVLRRLAAVQREDCLVASA